MHYRWSAGIEQYEAAAVGLCPLFSVLENASQRQTTYSKTGCASIKDAQEDVVY